MKMSDDYFDIKHLTWRTVDLQGARLDRPRRTDKSASQMSNFDDYFDIKHLTWRTVDLQGARLDRPRSFTFANTKTGET
jgi:hypothetical protein